MKKLIVLLCAAGLLVSACKEDFRSSDPKIFSISPASTSISAVSQTMEYSVDCDKDWTANMAIGLWASIKETNAENGRIVVTALLNDSTDSRSDTLIVKSGSKSLKVPFVQKGLNSILSSTSVTLIGTEPCTITVHASDNWTASIVGTIDASWITMDRNSGGKGNSEIKFQANEENLNVGDRNVLVKFVMGNDTFNATVTQKQTDAILKDPDKVELSNGAQNFSIALRYNVDYNINIDCDWIERVSTKALNSSTETFSVLANSKSNSREGTITFTGNGVTETVRVFQAECDQLAFLDGIPVVGSDPDIPGTANQRMLNIEAEGGIREVELKSNVEYDITWPAVDWLIPAEQSEKARLCAVRNDVLTFEVTPNRSLLPRTCLIVIKDHNSDLSASLLINQNGYIPEFMSEDAYGIYEANSGAIFAYTPKLDQIAVFKKEGASSFRIQNPYTGGFLIIEGIPEDTTEPFDITLKHNMSLGFPQENRYSNIVVAKTEGKKVWLYCEDGMGFIIKK